MKEYETEPMPGLPARLPEGERLLWQGSPDWRSLALNALHLRKLLVYFGILIGLRLVFALADGAPPAEAALTAAWLVPVAGLAIALLGLFAWASARTTLYTITSRRVVMRIGIALPMTLNIPFARVDGAALRRHDDQTGDIALKIGKGDRIAYLVLWPHARPLRFAHPEPMLRGLANPERASEILGSALRASAPSAAAVVAPPSTTTRPVGASPIAA